MGGTFDIIHIGHLQLLTKSFNISKFVIIGLTSDEYVKTHGKIIRNNFDTRIRNLHEFIKEKISSNSYEITKLENDFGPVMFSDQIECLVVSSETEVKGKEINNIRLNKGLSPIDVVKVDLVMAEDGKPISSRRIRSNEIDFMGQLLKKE